MGNLLGFDSFCEFALAYARRGWAVFPVHSVRVDGACTCFDDGCPISRRGKHPLTQHGHRDAACDAKKIKGFWTLTPWANVGISTGAVSGLVVLDVDPRNGGDESLSLLEQRFSPLPKTATVVTGGGGKHFYFKHPAALKISCANKLGGLAGLDLKADGGYVVAPPSLHCSGKKYLWEPDSSLDKIELSPLPQFILDLSFRKMAGENSQTSDVIGVGNRNNSLTSIAGTLRRIGLGDEKIGESLDALNSIILKEPLEEAEIEKISGSVSRYLPPQNSSPPLEFKTLTGTELLHREFPQSPCLVEDLMPAGGVGFIAGPSGARKTWLCLEIAICVSTGNPVFGQFPVLNPGHVLFVLGEDSLRSVQNRLSLLTHGKGLPDSALDKIHFLEATGILSSEELRKQLMTFCRKYSPKLLILDPFVRMHNADENVSKDIQPVLGFLRKIQREFRCAVWLTHHLSKNRSDDKRRSGRLMELMRGSGDLGAWADTVISIDRSGENSETPTSVTVAKQRDIPERPPFFFTLDISEKSAVINFHDGGLSDLKIQILSEKIFSELGKFSGGVPQKKLLENIPGNNQIKRSAIKKLAELGKIKIIDEPRLAQDGKTRKMPVVYLNNPTKKLEENHCETTTLN